ncbi:PopZ family protein [Microvirga alba]|uniref:DUF2497 domain-containing protein n=1 Tax=Microvirga alba TaxID=2791025 RepID=A0A931FR31_9HYPH|nr:DUF2497 domain-containing protein [Microvirga alba]MBF9234098.1 DUF2497 domain-containing protein [Microvirga alba]
MEEILASIRRIIADDQDAMLGAKSPEPSPGPSPLRNVLDLAERQSPLAFASEPKAPGLGAYDGDEGEDEDERAEPFEAPVADFEPVYKIEKLVPSPLSPLKETSSDRPAPSVPADNVLLSQETNASVSDAFNRLDSSLPASSPKSMEDLVKEMLRPMLKSWLDDNLPPLVERLVQAEIERVARRGR